MTIASRFRSFIHGLAIAVFIPGCGGGGGGAAVAPAITAQPAAASVPDHSTANFSVTASGDGPLSYQWRRDGADLVDGAGVAGATTAALSLAAPFTFNGSQIDVVVSNAAGSAASDAALLTVTPIAPTISAQPANTSVVVAATASFTVGIGGGTAPVTFQWRRDGVAIAGATAASYSLAAASLGDAGASFSVDVTNPAGTISSAAAVLSVAAVGRSWGPAVRISSGDVLHNPAGPQVAIDTAGNAIGVWQEAVGLSVRNGVWASRYGAGTGWSTPATIDDSVGNSGAPQLAMTPSGVAVATFVQSAANNGGGIRMQATRFDGSAWGGVARVDTLDAVIDADHRVAIAPDGAATLAFNQSDNVTGRRATASTSSAVGAWAAPEVIGATRSHEPQVAVAANGDAVMAWLVAETPSTGSVWASRRRGGIWSVPVRVVAGGKELASLRLGADASGNAVAVWQERPTVRTEVHATRLAAASGAWNVPARLNDGSLQAFAPRLAVGGAGDTLVVWSEAGDGGQAIGVVASRYAAGTAAWSGAARVQPSGANAGVQPSVAVDGAGHAIAVWLQAKPADAGKLEVWSARLDGAGAAWATPEQLTTDPLAYAVGGESQAPAITINAGGDAVVVWFERTDSPFSLGIWARVYR